MDYTIDSQPSYSLLEVTLAPGEELVTEAGAMAWMDSNIDVETSVRGGLMSGVKRAIGGGESFFQNTYTAQGAPGVIGLAPGQPGDIRAYEMDGGELLLERGAYLASTAGIETNADFQGLRGLFNEGLFILRVSGSGLLFFNAYGDIQEIEVDGAYVVDNGHAVAWEPSLDYRLTRAGRIRSFLFSDQIIMEFSGRPAGSGSSPATPAPSPTGYSPSAASSPSPTSPAACQPLPTASLRVDRPGQLGATGYDYGRDYGMVGTSQVWRSSVMDTNGDTRTMKASEFKAKCLKLMDEVAENGEEIVITKNGNPTARLVPYRARPKEWFGADRGKLEILGDILSPIDVVWEAEQGLIDGK